MPKRSHRVLQVKRGVKRGKEKWKEGWRDGKKKKILNSVKEKKKSYAEVAKNYSKNIYPWNCEEGKRNSYYFAIIPQTVKVMAQCMINV